MEAELGVGTAQAPQEPQPRDEAGNGSLKRRLGGLACELSFSEELEELEFHDGLGVLPFLGGKLLLVCQTKQMWPGDNIYFHNTEQIWCAGRSSVGPLMQKAWLPSI